MNWPVTRDREGESGIIFLDFSEIIKFTVEKGRRMVHTKNEIFFEPDNLERLESALKVVGLPFERADRGSLIDITKVMEIDEKNAIAYFEGPEPGSRGKESTISRPDNFNRIRRRFRELFARSKD